MKNTILLTEVFTQQIILTTVGKSDIHLFPDSHCFIIFKYNFFETSEPNIKSFKGTVWQVWINCLLYKHSSEIPIMINLEIGLWSNAARNNFTNIDFPILLLLGLQFSPLVYRKRMVDFCVWGKFSWALTQSKLDWLIMQ